MGRTIGGRYRLIAHLGGGAVSEVSLAKDGGELAVIKRLKLGADADPDVATQFADEARVSLRLEHPNIVRAIAASQDDEGPFLVLEYLDGQTLARIRSRASRRAGNLPRAIALHIAMGVTAGLAHAHAAKDESGKPLKIVHRNVSPDNIIVTYGGETKLIDFSVSTAKIAQAQGRAAATKGNIAYMAPEQGQSAILADERADVFAAGLVLWELLAGKRMWEGLSEADVIARLGEDKPLPSLRSVVPDMPEALDAICAKALTKVRDERYDSAVEMREAIESATKTLGLATTNEEVAKFVASLFEDEREKMRAVVEEAVASPADSARALPAVRPPAPSSSSKFVDVETDPKLWVGAAPAAPAPVRVEVVKVEAPSRDRRFTLLVGGAVLIAFAAVGVVALTHQSTPEAADVAQPVATGQPRPRGPVTSDPAAPSASAYVEPTEVAIEITVNPYTATLFVDGVKTGGSPYHTKVVPGKFVHEVRAEADGFEPQTMKVVFDRERTIEIALAPAAKPSVPFVPVVPVHRPAPSASAVPPARAP